VPQLFHVEHSSVWRGHFLSAKAWHGVGPGNKVFHVEHSMWPIGCVARTLLSAMVSGCSTHDDIRELRQHGSSLVGRNQVGATDVPRGTISQSTRFTPECSTWNTRLYGADIASFLRRDFVQTQKEKVHEMSRGGWLLSHFTAGED